MDARNGDCRRAVWSRSPEARVSSRNRLSYRRPTGREAGSVRCSEATNHRRPSCSLARPPATCPRLRLRPLTHVCSGVSLVQPHPGAQTGHGDVSRAVRVWAGRREGRGWSVGGDSVRPCLHELSSPFSLLRLRKAKSLAQPQPPGEGGERVCM